MKFFLVLALVGLASATLNYKSNGQTLLLNGQNTYGNLLSSGSYGGGLSLSRGYSSGLSGYSGLSGLSGYSGLSGLSGYSGLSGLAVAAPVSSNLVLAQAAPAYAVQSVQAVPAVSYAQQYAVAAPAAQYGYASQQVQGPIQAAIQSQRSVQVVDVASTGGYAAPQSVVIGPSVQPLDIEFQSQSSPVSVRQTHIPGQPNAPQVSRHEEQPDYLRQEIVKPVIHEVTEAIQPYRRITQEVRPVQETINQLITRGQQQQQVAVQAVQAVQAQPIAVQAVQAQPIAVQAVAQPSYAIAQPVSVAVAQPSVGLALTGAVAQPSYSLNIQNLNRPLSGLALSGSSSFSRPALSLGSLSSSSYGSYGSSSLAAPDEYRK